MERVILIDDDALNVYLNTILLKETWHPLEVVSYKSVEDALLDFTDTSFELPDLILLDINLPGLDAWDFLAQLCQQGMEVGELPLALLSSHVSPSDRQKISEYRLEEAVLTKPLNIDALLALEMP